MGTAVRPHLLVLLEEQRRLRDELEQQRVLMGAARRKLTAGELNSKDTGKKKETTRARKKRLHQVEGAMQSKLDELTAQFARVEAKIEADRCSQETELRALVLHELDPHTGTLSLHGPGHDIEHKNQMWLQLSPAEAARFKAEQVRAYAAQQRAAATGTALPVATAAALRNRQRGMPRASTAVADERFRASLEATLAAAPSFVAEKSRKEAKAEKKGPAKKDKKRRAKEERPQSRESAAAVAASRDAIEQLAEAAAAQARDGFVRPGRSPSTSPPGSDSQVSPPLGSDDVGYITDLETESEKERQKQAAEVRAMLRRSSGDLHLLRWEDISGASSVSKIGEGAFAHVFKGKIRSRACAIKVIKQSHSEKSLRSFVREVTLLEQFCGSTARANPHLVQFLGCVPGPEPDHFAIITELCAGGSLQDALHVKNVRFSVRHIISIATHLALGILSLHQGDVCHRDVTSHNVLLLNNISATGGEEPVIQLADFGISRVHRERGGPVRMSPTGNPRWVAPEVVRREAYDKAVDVWSFGMVLYELLTNHLPFHTIANEADILGAIRENNYPPFPDNCQPQLRDIAVHCFAADPAQRPKLKDIVRTLCQLRFLIEDEELDQPAMARLLELTPSEEAQFKQQQIQRYARERSDIVRTQSAPELRQDDFVLQSRRQQQTEVLLRTMRELPGLV